MINSQDTMGGQTIMIARGNGSLPGMFSLIESERVLSLLASLIIMIMIECNNDDSDDDDDGNIDGDLGSGVEMGEFGCRVIKMRPCVRGFYGF